MNKHIVRLIRERFHLLVRFWGPQHAGEVEVEGVRGPVFLGELSIWLWPAKSTHNGVLSDEQLGDIVSPHFLVRNLLLSAQTKAEATPKAVEIPLPAVASPASQTAVTSYPRKRSQQK